MHASHGLVLRRVLVRSTYIMMMMIGTGGFREDRQSGLVWIVNESDGNSTVVGYTMQSGHNIPGALLLSSGSGYLC
jgi:hypothetical protein